MVAYNLKNVETSQRFTVLREKNCILWGIFYGVLPDKIFRKINRFLPYRTCPPLVTLAVLPDVWAVIQVKVTNAKVSNLLNKCPGILKE